MQRLRRVRQLGTSHLVYQGATHSRFSHCLGTMRAAQDLLDAVQNNAAGPRPPASHLLGEWPSADFDLKWAEATVLARLGALMHDLCHVPFGHTIEDDLQVLEPHDANRLRFDRLWGTINAEALVALNEPRLKRELERLILSKEAHDDAPAGTFVSEYPFVADIVGNTICADLMDYLSRDHQATGLPMEVGVRFINEFYVVSGKNKLYHEKMVIKIDRNRHVRPDVVDEITKYLRYRYEESERVLFHHAKVSADAMIGKMLEMWTDSLWVRAASDQYPELVAQYPDLAELRVAIDDEPKGGGGSDATDIDARIRETVEVEFTRRSDDGLLEHLEEFGRAAADSRSKAVGQLATDILNRKLYKPIGVAEGEAARSNASTLHTMFGTASARRAVEMESARFADIAEKWRVVLWLPNPAMRFKAADVLVDKRGSISKLATIREGREARALVKKHQGLWSITAYADESVRNDVKMSQEVLSSLQAQMSIAFRTWEGQPVPPIEKIISGRLVQGSFINPTDEIRIHEIYHQRVAAKSQGTSFQAIAREIFNDAKTQGLISKDKKRPAQI